MNPHMVKNTCILSHHNSQELIWTKKDFTTSAGTVNYRLEFLVP